MNIYEDKHETGAIELNAMQPCVPFWEMPVAGWDSISQNDAGPP